MKAHLASITTDESLGDSRRVCAKHTDLEEQRAPFQDQNLLQFFSTSHLKEAATETESSICVTGHVPRVLGH